MSEIKVTDNKLFIALLCVLVWLPLPFGSNRPWAEAIFELAMFVIVWVWLISFYSGKLTISAPFIAARWVLTILLVWCGYCLLQLCPLPLSLRLLISPNNTQMYLQAGVTSWAPLSLYPYATFLFFLRSTAYLILFGLLLLLVNTRHRVVLLGYTLDFSGVFQACYGSIMTLSGLEYGFFIPKIANIGVASGTYINRNHLAGYLEMVSAVGIGLLLATTSTSVHARNWRQRLRNFIHLLLSQKLILRLMLATMVIALVLTRSRMGNTGFFSSMLVAGFFTLLAFRTQASSFKDMFSRNDTRSAVLLLSSLMIIDIFIVGAWFGVEKVADRISESSLAHDADRVDISVNSLNVLKDYPLTGSGGGTFHAVFPRYRVADIGAYFDHTHEDYLEITADTGAIGLVLLATVVILSLFAALFALFRRRDRLMRGMAFASIMGVTAILIHSTVDFNLQIPANAATFMVLLALAWIALSMDRASEISHASRSAHNKHHKLHPTASVTQ